MLWNLFQLASEAANQVAATSSSGCTAQQQTQLQQELQEQQQAPDAGTPLEAQQEQQQQQDLSGAEAAAVLRSSPVAQELVDVLAVALQQQVATCTSLQVRPWVLIDMHRLAAAVPNPLCVQCALACELGKLATSTAHHPGRRLMRVAWCT